VGNDTSLKITIILSFLKKIDHFGPCPPQGHEIPCQPSGLLSLSITEEGDLVRSIVLHMLTATLSRFIILVLCGIIGQRHEQQPTSMLEVSNIYAVYVTINKRENYFTAGIDLNLKCSTSYIYSIK
jgi:hypothetical protein